MLLTEKVAGRAGVSDFVITGRVPFYKINKNIGFRYYKKWGGTAK
jgi:hypothetical protein